MANLIVPGRFTRKCPGCGLTTHSRQDPRILLAAIGQLSDELVAAQAQEEPDLDQQAELLAMLRDSRAQLACVACAELTFGMPRDPDAVPREPEPSRPASPLLLH